MRVLHAIHDFLPRHCAGSEIYAFELCRQLAELGNEVHVLCAEYDPRRSHASLAWRWYQGIPVTELVNNWVFPSFDETYRSPRIATQLDHVLRAVQPEVLHIHNLLNLSFELPALAARQRVPAVATLHEFVLLCPSGGQRVHLAEEHVCHDIDISRCARCFVQSPFYSQMALARVSRHTSGLRVVGRLAGAVRARFPRLAARIGRTVAAQAPGAGITAADIGRRLEAVRQVYDAVELFVAPSPALGAEFVRFGLPEDKLRVSDYGFVPLDRRPRVPGDGRLRVGFVGTLVWHKGAHVVIEALRQLPPDRYELRVFGSLDTFPDYAAELRASAAGITARFEGGFDREQVAAVYAQIDVVVVSSLWPENSPLVIHEAWMAGVPVVGARMGGIVDLVGDDVNGLLYEATSPDSLASCLRRLIDQPGLLGRLREALPPVKSIDQDAREWEERYREVLARRKGAGV